MTMPRAWSHYHADSRQHVHPDGYVCGEGFGNPDPPILGVVDEPMKAGTPVVIDAATGHIRRDRSAEDMEPPTLTDAGLSRLLWDAREICDMFADIAEHTTGIRQTRMRAIIERIDTYRASRGWSPDGYGGEDGEGPSGT